MSNIQSLLPLLRYAVPSLHPELISRQSNFSLAQYLTGLFMRVWCLLLHNTLPPPDIIVFQATANSPYHRSVQDLAAAASGYSSSQASRLQSQYQSLFLNNPATAAAATSRLHAAAAGAGPTVKSEVPWSGSGDYHTPGAGDFSHHLDRNYSPHPYANMPPSGQSQRD